MIDVGDRLESLAAKYIPAFIEQGWLSYCYAPFNINVLIYTGIPVMEASQRHTADSYSNLSTVAALMSGVTATVLQSSLTLPVSRLAEAVNAFWFIALIFSVSATVNSLLALAWKQALL